MVGEGGSRERRMAGREGGEGGGRMELGMICELNQSSDGC